MNKRHADTDPPADMNKRHAGPDPAADHFFTIASQVRAASALDSRPHDNSSASASSSPPSEEQLQFADRFLAGSLHDHDVAPPPVVASSHEKSVTAAAAWEAARSQAANGGDDVCHLGSAHGQRRGSYVYYWADRPLQVWITRGRPSGRRRPGGAPGGPAVCCVCRVTQEPW